MLPDTFNDYINKYVREKSNNSLETQFYKSIENKLKLTYDELLEYDKSSLIETNQMSSINKYYEKRTELIHRKSIFPEFTNLNHNALKMIHKIYQFQINTIYPYQLNKLIEIKDSNIHNKGVFAICDIPEKTILTFYPCHGYSICLDKIRTSSDESNFLLTGCDEFFKSDVSNDYEFSVTNNFHICGINSKTSNFNLLGHMINDSCGQTFTEYTQTDIRNGIVKYVYYSHSNCRCFANKKNGYVYVIATKNIKKGEECFFSYEPSYWFYKKFKINPSDDELFNKIYQMSDIQNLIIKHSTNLFGNMIKWFN